MTTTSYIMIFRHVYIVTKVIIWKVRLLSASVNSLESLKSRTTPYHPQDNGTVERFNLTLLVMPGVLDPDEKREERLEEVPSLTHAYHATQEFSRPFILFSADI